MTEKDRREKMKKLNVLLLELADNACPRCLERKERIRELEKQLAESVPKGELERLLTPPAKENNNG